MPEDFSSGEQNNSLEDGGEPKLNPTGKNQKMAAAGLAAFAFLVVIIWAVQLKNSIYAPFYGPVDTTGSELVSGQTAADQVLRNKDTDSDGLTDYDESNIYKTSPYLSDSDGDGLSDGDEVKNGADPNCPTGRDCATSGFTDDGPVSSTTPSSTDVLNNLSNQSEALNSLLNQYNASQPATGSAGGGGTSDLTEEQKKALRNIDAASLRQLLLENGLEQDVLDSISDEELMKSYNETLQ